MVLSILILTAKIHTCWLELGRRLLLLSPVQAVPLDTLVLFVPHPMGVIARCLVTVRIRKASSSLLERLIKKGLCCPNPSVQQLNNNRTKHADFRLRPP